MSTTIPNSPIVPETSPGYPATLEVDYPDRKLNRLTSFFRCFTAIPISIIFTLLGSSVCLPLVLMLLFRKIYPKWWFDWNLNLTKFRYRIIAYSFLLMDEYPSTDAEQTVHLNMTYPDALTQLSRGWPLIKWLFVIPHYIIFDFLEIGVTICTIIAWFAILFTGRYPRGLFEFVVGVLRWSLRVEAYALILITDKYPPFSLSA